MLASKHFDPIMGVDIHIVTIPPAGPVPIPHPHISLVMDPMDYIPIIGGTVYVGGVPRATAGTAGQPVPHIPMGGPFVKPPGNEDEIFMGSATVLADEAPFTFTALPNLSCQDVGMPAPIRAKKPKKSYGMLLPTSTVMAIPAGLPVLVGGPPTIDMVGLAMAGAMKALGPLAKKLRGLQKKSKRIKKISKAIHKKAKKLMDKLGVPPNVRNKIHRGICSVTGHPVDVASGKMFTEHIDFELPGPIPFVWERVWYSTSIYSGPLGHGWHHKYDLKLSESDRSIAIRLEDGRSVAFPALKIGEESFDRGERLTLIKDDQGIYGLDNTQGLRYRFSPHKKDKENQLLREIVDKATKEKIQFFYDQSGRLDRIIDSAKRNIVLQYDEFDCISSILVPESDKNRQDQQFCCAEYEYLDGDLSASFDALKNVIRYRYDHHLMVKETNKNGLSFYFEYDALDHTARCIHTWGDNGIYNHKLVYDAENGLTVVEDSLGHKTKYFHDGVLPYRVEDPLGGVIQTEYNDYAQAVKEIDELGRETSMEYDDRGNTIKITEADGSVTELEFNDQDKLCKAIDPMGGEWQWEFSKCGLLTSKRDSLKRQTSFTYSDNNRLSEVLDPAGQITQFEFDAQGNLNVLRTSDGGESQFEYDALGRVIRAVDPKGNRRLVMYDSQGRVIHVKEADGNVRSLKYDPEGNVIHVKDQQYDIRYEYSGMGCLKARIEKGERIQFSYDTEEQLVEVVNEKGYAHQYTFDANGEVAYEIGFDSISRQYIRDAAGQVIRVERPGNRYSECEYDSLGRIVQVQHSGGDFEKFEYRADGLMTKASNNATEIELQLNLLGQIEKETQGDFWVASEYNVAGLRTRVSSSLGADICFKHSGLGDLLAVNVFNGKFETVFKNDQLGLELQRILPGGVKSKWQRDKLGRPLKQEISNDKNQFLDINYEWSIADRLVSTSTHLSKICDFEHDVTGNLVSTRYANGEIDLRVTDAVGNLYRSYSQADREYGPAGQITSSRGKRGTTKYIYDEEGRLSKKIAPENRVWCYEWNGVNMLKRVIRPDGKIVEFEYDALGRRTHKKFNGKVTRWVWDGDNPFHEWCHIEYDVSTPSTVGDEPLLSGEVNPVAMQPVQAQAPPPPTKDTFDGITWIFEPDTNEPMAKIVNDRYYSIITDYQGIPIQAFNHEGQLEWSAETKVSGRSVNLQGDVNFCPFRRPGQYADEETGLIYNRFRYYDPESEQYISQDPIGLDGGFQLYTYSSDPLVDIDLFGLAKKGGGSYSSVRRSRKRGEVHHMPAASVLHADNNAPLSHGRGSSIYMTKADHAKTASYKNMPGAKKHRARQQKLLSQGKFKDALEMDMKDIQKNFGKKYNDSMSEMLDYLEKKGKLTSKDVKGLKKKYCK